MNIEDMMREQMRAEADRMPELADLEARFERRHRRYRIVRAVQTGSAAAVLIALVAAAAVVVPRLTAADDPGFGDPGPTPSPVVEPDVLDAVIGYSLELPDAWREALDEGGISAFAPEGTGDLEAGTPHIPAAFFVAIVPSDESFFQVEERVRARYVQDEAVYGISMTEQQMEVGGRRATVFAGVYPSTLSEEFASDEPGGCPDCRTSDYVVHWIHGWTLQIRVVARSTQANEQWGADGFRIVASMEPVWTPGNAYQPKSGTVGTGIEMDEATEEVLRFMDARIAGRDAEVWLGEMAERAYGNNEGGLSLYSPTSNPHYASYRILVRDEVDANSYQYIVEIVEEYTDEGRTGSILEQLFVGPGPGPIRGARVCDPAGCD